MADWLEYEKQCTQYLNRKFGSLATFYHLGSSDSTVSDIRVVTNSGREFYMDAKLTPAQCGQFVLLPDIAKQCFVFSQRNKTPLTSQVQAMIDHMDRDFEAYKEAGTAGKELDLGDGGLIFSQWIISAYRRKGTEYFITNDYTILPLEDFGKHFTVTATYRIKRSGSRSVGSRTASKVISHIQGRGYPIRDWALKERKLCVWSDAPLHGTRFVLDGLEYMFARREDMYELRILSNTFHANVIFTIEGKGGKGLEDAEFAQALL